MNKIETISNYKIKLHTLIYDKFTVDDIMGNIIENFTRKNIGIMCSNMEDNIIGFSVSITDDNIIREIVYKAYSKYFSQMVPTTTEEWKLPDNIPIDNLYNLTILNNGIDRSNVLLVL